MYIYNISIVEVYKIQAKLSMGCQR